MTEQAAAPTASELEEARQRSLQADLRLLADDAKALAQAELTYQKSRAAFAGEETKRIAILGVVAAVLAFFALMALVVGLVLALATVIGPWGSTVVVTLLLAAIATTFALMAASRARHMKATLSEGKAN